MGPELGADDVDQGARRGGGCFDCGGVPGNGAAIPLSALVESGIFAGGCGDEDAHRKGGGESRRDRAQRQAGAGRDSRNRIHRPNITTAPCRPHPVSAKFPNLACLAKTARLSPACSERSRGPVEGLLFSARRGASLADGGRSADPHYSRRRKGPRSIGRFNGF